MENLKFNKLSTHNLIIEGEKFPIYHKDRRLYGFMDWKECREKLIGLMLKKIKEKTGYSTAYIKFKMANPMRISRLGNFFIDIDANVTIEGKSLGTLEELGMKKIHVDKFEVLDIEEVLMRQEVEEKFSEIDFKEEFNNRLMNLKAINNVNENNLDNLEYLTMKRMKEEGWSTTADNRYFARFKRLLESSNFDKNDEYFQTI